MRYIVLIPLLLLAISCDHEVGLAEGEKREVESTIRQVLNDYYSDINERGLTAEFEYLDSSQDFFWVPPGYSSALSYDSVAAVLKRNAPLLKTVVNKFDTLSIIALSTNLATYTARIQSVVTDINGQVAMTNLVETGVLIKRRSGWKLLSGQTAIIDNTTATENNP